VIPNALSAHGQAAGSPWARFLTGWATWKQFVRNGCNVRTRTVSRRLLDIVWHTYQHRLATATETHNAMTDCGDDGWGA